MRHIILWSVALSVIFTSASCRKKPPAPVQGPIKAAETGQTSDDLQVTPLGAGHNEIADILGVQMWRFHIACNLPDAHILHTIGLQRKGQWVKEIAGGLSRWSGGDSDKQMIVALYPLDGDIKTSDRLKTHVRIGGTIFSRIGDNPMKGRHGTTTLSVANRQKDGSFLLMQFSESGSYPGENNTQLVLKITASQAQDAPPPQ